MNIDEASQELGKSLAKILLSEKYNDFTYNQCISIITNARNNAISILRQDAGIYDSIKVEPEQTRGEDQNGNQSN